MHGPIGPARDDYLAAMIASTVASCLSQKPPPFSTFLPDWPDIMKGDADGDDS